jgi:replicative DNA helicase
LLLDNSAYERVGDLLLPDHFYRLQHRAIYATMCSMIVACKPVDVITVYESGGHEMKYLNELVASVPTAANARRYAEIVLERWRARQAIGIAHSLIDDMYRMQGDALPKRVDAAVVELVKVAEGGLAKEAVSAEEAGVAFLNHLQEVAAGNDPTISTGIFKLDRLLSGGLRDGELIVLGGRPSMGKTAMELHLAEHVGRSVPVLILQQEDSTNTMMQRLFAKMGRINLARLRQPRNDDAAMWSGVTDAMDQLRDLRLYIDDQAGLSLIDVRRKVQAAKRKWGIRLVLIDYLQLMVGEGETRNRMLGDIANGLKTLAKQMQLPVVLLSQLSRKADETSGPPQMSHLRDSGDIEGAADIIILLHREFVRSQRPEQKHWAELNVAKQKNGPIETLDCYFDGAHQVWGDWDHTLPVPRGGRHKKDQGPEQGME